MISMQQQIQPAKRRNEDEKINKKISISFTKMKNSNFYNKLSVNKKCQKS